jgi:hypothetical protein
MKFIISVLFLISLSAHSETTRPSSRQWQAGIGPAISSGLNTPGLMTAWRFGYMVGLQPDWDLGVVFDWAISKENTDTHFFSVAAAADYYFWRDSDAPFVLGQLGYGSVHAHRDCAAPECYKSGDEVGGLAMSVGAGYKFFRASMFNLSVLARYDFFFGETTHGTPSKTSLQAILYY